MCPTATEAVDAIQDRNGRFPAARASHAKGTLCRGVFRPTGEAAALTTAAHMQGPEVDVTVRFSNASTNPGVHDGNRGVRGMAVRFYLNDAHTEYTDLVAVTMRSFFARTPQEFVQLTRARGPLGELRQLILLRGKALKALAAARQKPVPSYANCRFNSLHAFRWVNGTQARWVRYSWLTTEGERSLDPRDAGQRDRDYLQQGLRTRLDQAPAWPIKFRLQLQLASVHDDLFDPSKAWPRESAEILRAESGERGPRFVHAGELEVTGIDYETNAGQLRNFDPTHVTQGIEAPVQDSILQFRPGAYAVSFGRRTGKQE